MQITPRKLFIGIPVTQKTCPKFFNWTENLMKEASSAGLKVRWSKPSGYHITIRFLGESDCHPLDQIVSTLKDHTFDSFWIQIQQLGFFFNEKHANVMWAGVKSDEIDAFYEGIQQKMITLGYPPQTRPFQPHITLGRMKKFNHELKEGSIATSLDQFKMNRFCLYETLLTDMRLEYKILESFGCK